MSDKTRVKGNFDRPLRIFEAFAGIGAQRKALRNINKDFEVKGMAEWYVPAIVSYQAIHNELSPKTVEHNVPRNEMEEFLENQTLSIDSKVPVAKGYWKRKNINDLRIIYTAVKKSKEEGNIFDVRTLYKRTLSDIDLLTYSFPCQDLSQQGIQRGMAKDSGTRSGLLWEIEKALDATPANKRPKYLLMENVTALLNKLNDEQFKLWLNKLESLGYKNSYGILNAADFGSSQARRRAFMVSTLGKEIKLPVGTKKPQAISKVLDKEPKRNNFMTALDKYDITEFKLTPSNINKGRLVDYSTFNSEAYIYDLNYTGPTLTASGANSRVKILYEGKVRKLGASETYRYMGFSDKDFEKVTNLNLVNENQMIYTCGNSISVEVLEAIMEKF